MKKIMVFSVLVNFHPISCIDLCVFYDLLWTVIQSYPLCFHSMSSSLHLQFLFHSTASSLRLDSSGGDDVDKLAVNELFEVH